MWRAMSALVDRRHRPAGHQRPGARRRAARHRPGRRARRSTTAASRRSSRPGAPADERIDAGGRCVIPGFVDSHTHLVFAGDRADEFAARMAGAPYEAGGIRVTTDGDPRGERPTSCVALADGAPRRGPRAPAPPTSRSSRATASTSRTSGGCCEVAARAHRRRHVPRRPRGAGRVRGPRRRLRRPRLRRDARRVRAARAAGSTRSASAARSTPTSPAPCSRPAAPPASACACTATSSAPGPGVQLAVELGAASVDHCTYLDDADIEALAGERHRGDVPAGHRLLDPPALPRRPPRDRRRRDGRDRDELQPGLELHDVDVVLHRARRPRHAHDDRRGVQAATLGGAAALRRDDVGRLAPGARADAVVLDAPPTPISSTAPACRWS